MKRVNLKDYLKKNPDSSVKKMSDDLMVSRQYLHRSLKALQERGDVEKMGTSPMVFYNLADSGGKSYVKTIPLSKKDESTINSNFLHITPLGEITKGTQGLFKWIQERNRPIEKTIKEYLHTLQKYEGMKSHDLLDASSKMQATFLEVYTDKTFYVDFYSIEVFGKTKLGQLLLYAKQSQDKRMIKEISEIMGPIIKKLIKREKVNAVAFVPPSVKREIQIMKYFEQYLKIELPKIEIVKVKQDVIVPQKTLKSLRDRVTNASKTFVVKPVDITYNKVLLIDDAVGSGATLNQISKQIKDKKIAKKVIGLAVTGSIKGFDVISEV